MAQQYTKLMRTIWNDEDFRALPFDSKLIFAMLMSQPDINAVGVLGLRPKRWATHFPDRTQAQIVKAMVPLVEGRFIIVDRDTEEVFVRSFIVHDGCWKQTNGMRSLANARRTVLSDLICRLIDEIVATLDPKKSDDIPPTPPGTVDRTVDETVEPTAPSRALLEPVTANLEPSSSSSSGAVAPEDDDDLRSKVLSLALTIGAQRKATSPEAWKPTVRADWLDNRRQELTDAIRSTDDYRRAADAFLVAIGIPDPIDHATHPKVVSLTSATTFGRSVAQAEVNAGSELDEDGFRGLCYERPDEWTQAAFDAYREIHTQLATVTELRGAS